MARWKDINWGLKGSETDESVNGDNIRLALLMDVRDRLDVLRCPGFVGIPPTLSAILAELRQLNRKLARPRRKRKARK